MPNNKVVLTKAEVRRGDMLKDIPAITRIKIDRRADKYKKIGK